MLLYIDKVTKVWYTMLEMAHSTMSTTILSRLLKITAVISVGIQSVMFTQTGLENFSLYRQLSEIRSELRERNNYVRSMCRKHALPTEQFYFDLKDEIPGTTACVVGKGEKREFLVITKAILPTFQL
jgi:hypothetical protein